MGWDRIGVVRPAASAQLGARFGERVMDVPVQVAVGSCQGADAAPASYAAFNAARSRAFLPMGLHRTPFSGPVCPLIIAAD